MFYAGAPGSCAALYESSQTGRRFCRLCRLGRAKVCSSEPWKKKRKDARDSDRSQIRMAKNILITGGAGFVGSHLADGLLSAGHNVRIFDNLTPQVHGGQVPGYLNREA